ncbi:unnamed protein product, partial [Adineta steineri]
MFSRTKLAATATKGSTVPKEQRLTISGRSEAIASFGQQRIWFHEQLYFHASDLSVYNIVVPLIIKQGSLSIERLRSALRSVIEEHTVLRTAVRFNPGTNQIEQYIQPVTDNIYLFQHSRGISTAEQLDDLLTDESIRKHFDIENGRVVKCHVVERGDENHGYLLHENDLIVFTIHHIAFDLTSSKSFVKAFERACWIDTHHQSTLLIQQYIDFALYEQAMLADGNPNSKMNKARRFWSDLMHSYDWNRIRAFVPTESKHNQTRSGRGYSTVFTFDQRVVDAMMIFASSSDITMFSLSFASFYAFLFKLLNDENDLCVASVVANRFNQETKEMIGMFVNILPYRIQVEPNKSFNHFVRKVQQLNTNILEHASLPYQEIIGLHDKQKHQRLPSTLFQYDSLISSVTQKSIMELTVGKDSVIGAYYDRDRSRGNGLAIFDMAVTIAHDHHVRTTECVIDCAVEIFQSQAIVNELANRFQHMLAQLFCSSLIDEPIYKLSVVSSNEENLIHQFDNAHIASSDSCTSTIQEYSTIKNQMSMATASLFWFNTLRDFKLGQPLSLPYDRYRLMDEHRTGHTTSVSFDFGQDLSHHFLTYASSHNIKREHLALATYFIFLFKLTNGEKDLCISINIDNRDRDELKSIIGLFENIVALRCQLDPHWSFHQLLEHVREMTINSMKYSYFPLQRILNQHPNVSKLAFLDISFQFLSSMTRSDDKLARIGDSQLSLIPSTMNINDNEITNKYDFTLLIQHDLNINQFSCTINASLDLFNVETIHKISQRFHSIMKQLFISVDDQMNKPIYELSLTLPNERLLMQSMNNTQVLFSSPDTCIHHEFVYQVMKHPQKLAVELDEQSLTYCELLYYVQIVGLLSIEIIGGVYCPLSPENPQQRLQNFIEQTQARLILVHSLTNRIFKNNFIIYDIDTAINNNDKISNDYLNQLSNISITPDNISYVVFTSGSTGIPKAVQVRHRNLTAYIQSFAEMTTLKNSDNVIQMASCSFDNHFQETLGTLMIGAGLVMLHPHGNKDLTYFIHELMNKDVTILDAVPSYLDTICQYLEIQNANDCLKNLRALYSGGDVLTNQIISRLKKYLSIPSSLSDGCRLWNMYGQAEVTITTTYFQVGFDFDCDKQVMSIGKPLPNYQCAVMNEYFQFTSVNQEGELFVGGACVFAGYFGRDGLTAKVLVEINNDVFYRSGDLVRYDHQGFLYFKGRKDHQVKLRGQRIELDEIEKCLMNTSSLVSACTVIKWNEQHLVAYVQCIDVNEELLLQQCRYNLPSYMVPSIFILLEQFPLNPNGKIDRKLLPSPNFSPTHLTSSIELLLPTNDIETSIHHIWFDILKQKQISTNTNIFSIGGHSINIMQLFH